MPRINVPFVVDKQHITQPTGEKLVSGGQNYFYATFVTNEIWENISNLKAVFVRDDISKLIGLTKTNAGYECRIPWEVMATKGAFQVGIFGGDRLLTDYTCVIVKQGCATGGENPKPPTPDWFDDIEKQIEDLSDNQGGGGVPQEYIDEQIAVVKSDIEGLQKQIQEESHFRGYLSTNAKIQALEATPNDFAYSAESGTVWIYDAEQGWQNTSTPVPDKGTPLSNATPLINGIASAGTSEEGARSDHRHPTDTTRASAEDVRLIESTLWTVKDRLVELEYDFYDTIVLTNDYTESANVSLFLQHNEVYYFSEVTTLILSISSDINIEDLHELFECSILFTSGETATNLDYSASPIVWSGDDCDSDGHFVPEANKTYEISIKKLGLIISARVGVI